MKRDYFNLDYDVPFRRWKSYYPIQRIVQDAEKIGLKSLYIRRSANGHIHLKVFLMKPLNFYKLLELRAIYNDDAYRIRADLRRLHYKSLIVRFDILWDIKSGGKTKGIKRAGKWKKIILYSSSFLK